MSILARTPAAPLVLVALFALLSACSDEEQQARIPTSVRSETSRPPVEQPAAELLSSQQAFIAVSSRVTPAVVNISAARITPDRQLPAFFDDFFGEPLPESPHGRRTEQSLGSGFIISTDGYILTNEHVVKGAEEIKVRLSDARIYPGKLIGVDPRTDVAVLKIEAGAGLTAAVLGDSDKLQVGQWALAIGNPFGLDRTLTVGVISATGRANVGIEDYEDFVQTDASINPGNSGGPLLNIYGEVIGINTAIVASGQGIGFAIPINLARLIAKQLIEKGEVTRGWLGVSIQPLTPELAESFGLDKVSGALVNQVIPDSPAAVAGLRRGDILLTFGGKEVKGVRELQLLVANTPVDSVVPLEVLRQNKRLTVSVTIVAQTPPPVTRRPPPARSEEGKGLGLAVAATEEGDGVLVARVEAASAAAAAGVRPGDVILAVNGNETGTPTAFENAVRKALRAKHVVLLLRRGATTLYLAFAPG